MLAGTYGIRPFTAADMYYIIYYLKLQPMYHILREVKDVVYDTSKEEIISIPNLKFNKAKQKFTLRNTDKKKSSLKCLAPRKKKNKIDIHLNVNN